jgi:anti-sigma B factor antagonist
VASNSEAVFDHPIFYFNRHKSVILLQSAPDLGPFRMILITEVFEYEPDITGLSCAGRFTLGTRLSETEAMVNNLLDRGVRKLVLDLTQVDFVDSAGLGIIMRIYGEMAERGGQFRIAGPREQVRRLFDITKTSTILPLDPDLMTSLQQLQEGKAAGTV